MDSPLYEHHPHEIFRDRRVPVICHRDLLRQRENSLFHMHWHENPEFIRFQAGTGYALVSSQRYEFLPGTLICVNPNEPHKFIAAGEDPHIIYDCMIVDAAFCQENGLDLSKLRFSPVVMDDVAGELFDRAFEAFYETGPLHTLSARTAVLEFLLYLCRSHPEDTGSRSAALGMEALKNAVIYIRSNFMHPITLEDAAKQAGFSVYYFSRAFKKLTGQTFVTFLNTVRCENAAQRIRNGASVTEACFSCGFQEVSYFSRIFKRLIGVSPSEVAKHEHPDRAAK